MGLLSEVLGSSLIEKDRAARLFLYRGDAHREWAAYGPRARRIIEAFVSGINEYIKVVEAYPHLMPDEFRQLGYKPAVWSPEDVTRIRSHGLYKNLNSEVKRAQVLRDFGQEIESLRRRIEPPHQLTIPAGIDLSLISDDVLRVYDLATSPIDLSTDPSGTGLEQTLEGSNNWAISSERTATGRPILANDPHRTQSLPSLRYIVHLSAPGMEVIGAGEPALPGISIGHNDQIAFGLTVFSIDQEDLYVYRTNPENPQEYEYRGQWETMAIEEHRIPVKGQGFVKVELKFTRHGPVIYEYVDRHVAFAVRAAWLEPGMAPYLGSLNYMNARNWEQFLAAMEAWGAPGENHVYADTKGNIGWKAAGLIPKRPNWDGLLPVPGDGSYEWEGFLDTIDLPIEFNPSRGWIATANQMNLPPDFPYEEKSISFEWQNPFRYQRIAEYLDGNHDHTVEGSVNLQNDYLSVPARRIVAVLGRLRPINKNERMNHALRMLEQWDCVLAADSAAAALFEVWYRFFLRRELMAQILLFKVGDKALAEMIAAVTSDGELADARTVLEVIETPTSDSLGLESLRICNEAMLCSLWQAIKFLDNVLGTENMEAWRWGDLHHASFVYPVAVLRDIESRKRSIQGPIRRGGSGDTVGNTSYQTQDFLQTGGSSWRIVVDVGRWDNSFAMNAPGQSGDPRSAHYADLVSMWADDKAFPLLYSRKRVEESAEQVIHLYPSTRAIVAPH